ncbi:UPF0175 family protein [Flammeovirgaceae bacterium SG7u.111]|nr:UPF0175 family protein [Flammeovirgaceae bacterium SG7u.132]WPO34136.1 UPF0175 family protein [Flammeovirgaceae bacterium SG7u.111]
MNQLIAVNYPESLAFSLKMEKGGFEEEIKKLSMIKLYEIGKIPSGNAAKILNISRLDFLDI